MEYNYQNSRKYVTFVELNVNNVDVLLGLFLYVKKHFESATD